jgi:hypothetical protein
VALDLRPVEGGYVQHYTKRDPFSWVWEPKPGMKTVPISRPRLSRAIDFAILLRRARQEGGLTGNTQHTISKETLRAGTTIGYRGRFAWKSGIKALG